MRALSSQVTESAVRFFWALSSRNVGEPALLRVFSVYFSRSVSRDKMSIGEPV